MFQNKFLLVILVTFYQLWQVNCNSEDKPSLVFVIDDTGSMADDIDQVKTQVDNIFESAITSNDSNTENFVIVTFNDPGSKHRTTTKDKDEFKKALANITVYGGGDCPELAMEGLELALRNSGNGSLVYLFTDADAKDFDKYEVVKSLAIQKNCRLHFILTNTCELCGNQSGSYNEPGHRIFFDLAEATGGQVFSSYKQEVGDVLGHVRASVAGGYDTIVASEVIPRSADSEADIPAGVRYSTGGCYDETISVRFDGSEAGDIAKVPPTTTIPPGVALEPYHFNVTEGVKSLLVSVSGFHPTVELIGPDGTAPKTEDVTTTSGVKVIKIIDAKPGQYTAKVTSLGRTSIVISGNESGAPKDKSES